MTTGSGRPAIFLDRDGTLNEELGYVNHRGRFRLFPWSIEAVRLIREEGYLAILITNQSGIDRGILGEDILRQIHAELSKALAAAGTALDGLYHCPHAPARECDCRKPRPGMLLQAQRDHDIDLSRSFMVGDSYRDLECGWNVGVRGALVLTGAGRGSYELERESWPRQPDVVGTNLFDALAKIFWD